jgi:hypothetical protein
LTEHLRELEKAANATEDARLASLKAQQGIKGAVDQTEAMVQDLAREIDKEDGRRLRSPVELPAYEYPFPVRHKCGPGCYWFEQVERAS